MIRRPTISLVNNFAGRIIVTKRGEIVEKGMTRALFADPRHSMRVRC
jgi:ABC-type microcin C transport system duplicated ATPase subunit YejF